MRTHELGPDTLTSLFAAHHAKEAAEHGEAAPPCDCPPGACGDEVAEKFFDEAAERFARALFGDNIIIQPAGDFLDDVIFEDDETVGLSRSEQLDQLGEIVHGVTNLATLYAAMVDEDRG